MFPRTIHFLFRSNYQFTIRFSLQCNSICKHARCTTSFQRMRTRMCELILKRRPALRFKLKVAEHKTRKYTLLTKKSQFRFKDKPLNSYYYYLPFVSLGLDSCLLLINLCCNRTLIFSSKLIDLT